MKETFPIIPASNSTIWFCVGLAIFFVGLIVLFGYMAYSSRHITFEVSSAGLRIAGDLYGRQIPMEVLRLDEARTVDLTRDEGYRLRWRTNGAGLPGYKAGWFRLRNGEKGLVFVTDKHHVLYLPTTQGYSVLLSVAHPEMLLGALERASTAQ